MPLPRSVIMESGDSFVPRHVASNKYRGFSFIQEGFMLPDRSNDEVEKYWDSHEEDGESASECASSKFDAEFDAEEAAAGEPEKKKRPPRKRKKKNKDEVATLGTKSAASSIDGRKTPAQSDDEAESNKEKVDITDKNKTEIQSAAPAPAVGPKVDKAPVAEPRSVPAAKPAIQTKPQPQPAQQVQPTKAVPKQSQVPAPKPYSLDRSNNQKYMPPQRRGVPPGNLAAHSMTQDQRQHYIQNPGQKGPGGKAGWAVAHQHQIPSKGPIQPKAAPTLQPSWNTPAPPSQPKGPPPGSWAAKISAQKAKPVTPPAAPVRAPQARTPQQQRPMNYAANPPPASPLHVDKPQVEIPPSPSSDWRHHHMNPSPATARKITDTWPGLGDFPPPPAMGPPSTAPKAAKPSLQGAWTAPKTAKPSLQGAWGAKK